MCLYAVLNQQPTATNHKYSMFNKRNMASILSIPNKAKNDTFSLRFCELVGISRQG